MNKGWYLIVSENYLQRLPVFESAKIAFLHISLPMRSKISRSIFGAPLFVLEELASCLGKLNEADWFDCWVPTTTFSNSDCSITLLPLVSFFKSDFFLDLDFGTPFSCVFISDWWALPIAFSLSTLNIVSNPSTFEGTGCWIPIVLSVPSCSIIVPPTSDCWLLLPPPEKQQWQQDAVKLSWPQPRAYTVVMANLQKRNEHTHETWQVLAIGFKGWRPRYVTAWSRLWVLWRLQKKRKKHITVKTSSHSHLTN